VKIAIIGAGAAGLTTAWLLDQDHDVTVYEKDERLGGHADTINVTVGDQVVPIDAGFEFFSDVMFPTYKRLLNLLNVPTQPFDMIVNMYDTRTGHNYLLPPFRHGRVYLDALTPLKLIDMLRFQWVLRASGTLNKSQDSTITVAQFLEQLGLSEAYQTRFMYPYLQAGWGVSRAILETFSAYNVLRYSYLNKPDGFMPRGWQEVAGGSQQYIQALSDSLTRTRIRRGAGARCVSAVEGGYAVTDDSSSSAVFDQVVLATNANQAAALIDSMPDRAEVVRLLNGITYFQTTIAIHGDTRLMPPKRRHWSVVNIRHDDQYSQFTIWKKWKSAVPVFKSWITHDQRQPEPLYKVVKYWHPQVDAAYFTAQKMLQRHQGVNNLWLAGMYMHDVDCHESAVISAIKVAQALAPDSSRLRQLARDHAVPVI